MKIIKLVLIPVFALLIGGFGYFALTDVPVEQNEITKEVPHERLREH